MNEKVTIDLPKFWYRLMYVKQEFRIDFEAFEIVSQIEEGDKPPVADEISETASIKGYRKGDGCCELEIKEHLCGRHEIVNINGVMNYIYDLQEEIFEKG